MKCIYALLLAASFLAHAEDQQTYETSISCGIVTWEQQEPKSHVLKWENVKLKEGEETEILKTESAVYLVYIDQHDTKFDPKDSSLFLTIKTLDGKSIAETSAFWPRQPANGSLEGFGRLEVETDLAEPNVHTQFLCDNRLLTKK